MAFLEALKRLGENPVFCWHDWITISFVDNVGDSSSNVASFQQCRKCGKRRAI